MQICFLDTEDVIHYKSVPPKQSTKNAALIF
jgi:hypothetical protein